MQQDDGRRSAAKLLWHMLRAGHMQVAAVQLTQGCLWLLTTPLHARGFKQELVAAVGWQQHLYKASQHCCWPHLPA